MKMTIIFSSLFAIGSAIYTGIAMKNFDAGYAVFFALGTIVISLHSLRK